MSSAAWLSFISYNLITSITPGPMNIVAMNAAGNHGLRRSRPVFWGLTSGLSVVLLLCGLFSTTLAAILPGLVGIMKYIGSAYMVWIAWTILRSRPEAADLQSGEVTFSRAFLLQFVNIKAYIWAITVYTAYALPSSSGITTILSFAGMMLVIAVACAFVWAMSGALLSSVLQKYRMISNGIMALMLLYSSISLLLT